jgi:predicted N-formylglutamate amidohydrolase
MLARRLHAPCFTGRYSRLLVDLNRSRGHRHLIAAERFGHPIPGNRDLTPGEREARIARYWQPYRDAVERAVQRRILRGGSCLHLSVHSFAPVLGGETRTADVGLLYDPQRHRERAFAHWMRRALTESGLATRMNYPYAGTSDGFTTYCRRRWPGSRYLGIELEVNQRRLRTGRALCHTGRVLSDAVAEAAERWIRRAVGRG